MGSSGSDRTLPAPPYAPSLERLSYAALATGGTGAAAPMGVPVSTWMRVESNRDMQLNPYARPVPLADQGGDVGVGAGTPPSCPLVVNAGVLRCWLYRGTTGSFSPVKSKSKKIDASRCSSSTSSSLAASAGRELPERSPPVR